MAYHTTVYLFVFLPAALLAYQLTPKKMRWVTLVLSGYVFFWTISGKLVLYLIGTSLVTHYIGVWLSAVKLKYKMAVSEVSREETSEIRKQYKKKEKIILAGGIFLLLSALIYLKYYNFFVQNANILLETAGSKFLFESRALLLPIGISFYTLQAIGYMADVYWGKVDGQQHPGKIALFLGFFPQIMEGPISQYSQITETLWEGHSLKGENLSRGSVRILWGLFKKMIIADRLYVLVQAVFEHYENYQGVMIVAAAVAHHAGSVV